MVRPLVFALMLALAFRQPLCHAQEAANTASATPAAPVAASLASAAAPASDPAVVSHVRIVRLSQIQGKAQLDRNTGRGFEPAFANIPITAGARLMTTSEGTAEVEFEEGSTLRLAPATEVKFTELGRTATGQTVTVVRLVQGMAYVTLARTPTARFALLTDQATMTLRPGSHVRLGFGAGEAQLAVLDGAVDVQGPAGDTVVAKKQSMAFQPVGSEPYTVASEIKPEPFDSWDKESDKYQRRYATASFSGGTGTMYGSADLNYYGGFVDMPGCGSLWRPYFASAAWDPYASGVWAWYPGAGYSWVSPYPWGWTPYHSGSWQNCPGSGWGWSPNASWYGLGNQPHLLHRIAMKGHGPIEPAPPGKGAPHYVVSGSNQLQYSRLSAPGTFTFRSDSAGMGVPRESFGGLRGFSNAVAHHGAAMTEAEIGVEGEGRAAGPGAHLGAGVGAHPIAVLGRPGAHSGAGEGFATAGQAGAWSAPGAGRSAGSSGPASGHSMGSHVGSSVGGSMGGSMGASMSRGSVGGAAGAPSSGGGGHH